MGGTRKTTAAQHSRQGSKQTEKTHSDTQTAADSGSVTGVTKKSTGRKKQKTTSKNPTDGDTSRLNSHTGTRPTDGEKKSHKTKLTAAVSEMNQQHNTAKAAATAAAGAAASS